jgi:UDP-GlcNAc3NAcA epimerase
LRSFNRLTPEEINRIFTDNISDILFCPTKTSVKNLENEGFANKSVRVLQIGDVMQDAMLMFSENAVAPEGHIPNKFVLATLHRAENTDSPERLARIVKDLNEIHKNILPVVLPIHPRTRKAVAMQGLELDVYLIDPVRYFEMLWLLKRCQLVLTDSGGVQKEAFFAGKPCVTMRDQTEWVELLELGGNVLVGSDGLKIIDAVRQSLGKRVKDVDSLYGGGQAAKRIVEELLKN